MVQLRKALIEEERIKELRKKIEAKEERINNLMFIRELSKEKRHITYDQRKEKFKNEIKQRRKHLSRTPARNTSTKRMSDTGNFGSKHFSQEKGEQKV